MKGEYGFQRLGFEDKRRKLIVLGLIALLLFVHFMIAGFVEGDTSEQLEIRNFQYVENLGDPEGKMRDDLVLDEGDDLIYFVFQIWGLEEENDEVKLSQELTILNPDGGKIYEATILDDRFKIGEKDFLNVYFYHYYEQTEFSIGEHTLQIKVKDRFVDQTTIHTNSFEVRSS